MTETAVSVLFDEYHHEQPTLDGRSGIQVALTLQTELPDMGYVLQAGDEPLLQNVLKRAHILMILGPESPFRLDEIEAIVSFVQDGGGLLLVSDYDIMWQQYRYSLNELAGRFGFAFREYFNWQPQRTETLEAHFVTAGVSALGLHDSCCIRLAESTNATQRPIAWLSDAREDLLGLCIELGAGRVVALSDSALFMEAGWPREDNSAFIFNTFSWLARRNLVDVAKVQLTDEVVVNRRAQIQVVLSNPSTRRLENIQCYLEAPTGVEIEKGEVSIRSISGHGTATLSWYITPRTLGRQLLGLTIESDDRTVFFDRLVEFRAVAPGRLRAVVTDVEGHQQSSFETDQEFSIEAFLESNNRAEIPLGLKLPESVELVQQQDSPGTQRWIIRAREPGLHQLTCEIPESSQIAQISVTIKATLQYQIEDLKQRWLQPLDAEIARRLCEVHPSLTDERMQAVPFHVLTPEEFVTRLYPSEVATRLHEVIQAARRETHFNPVLLSELLVNIAPLYSPKEGGCAPFDPALASRWATLHPEQREQLEYNLLKAEDSDESVAQQNLTAYLLHEKYGHGYFYTHTTLGRQLGILYRHGFIREVDRERLAVPYPQSLYTEYATAIEALRHSAIIVNEGIAAWIELSLLERMEPDISRVHYRRKIFLIERATRLDELSKQSKYFKAFPHLFDSPYQEGCEKFVAVQKWFGAPYGQKCALHVAVKAAEVDLGIEEVGTTIHFGLPSKIMRDALLDPKQPDHARADNRLRHINHVLFDNRDRVRSAQRQLKCYRTCLHPQCPIYEIIREKLGW